MKRLLHIPFLIAMFLLPAAAQGASRTQDYLQDLVRLSGILGGAHGLRVSCSGQTDQYWRSQMSQLLAIEAPTSSVLRTSMVDAFNRGYMIESDRNGVCTQATVRAEAAYAAEGRAVSDRLAEANLPPRPESQRRR